MARLAHDMDRSTTDDMVVDRVTTRDTNLMNVLARILGLIAAAVPTIVGLIAVADVDWSGKGFDAAPVTVADIRFSPAMAVGLLALGVLGLIAAALPDRTSKFVMGAIFVITGVVVLLANPTVQHVQTSDRLGWMAVLVGAVLLLAGLFASQRTTVRREARTIDEGYA